jgi:hypothetical protein
LSTRDRGVVVVAAAVLWAVVLVLLLLLLPDFPTRDRAFGVRNYLELAWTMHSRVQLLMFVLDFDSTMRRGRKKRRRTRN